MEETLPEVTQGLDADDQLPKAPAAEAPEVDPGETTETPEDSGAKPAEKPDGIQRRIDELTRKRHEAQREAAYWRGQAEAGVSKPETAPAEAEPKQEAFQSYEEYLRAVARWEVSQSLAVERTRLRQEHQAQTVAQGFDAQVKTAREKHADFDAVVYNEDLQISETMRDCMLHAEGGAALAYHLGQNPEEAARIAGLPQNAQIIEIGALVGMRRLQAKLKANPTIPVPSNAPAPITPVRASAPATTGLRETLSIGDWMQRRNAELRKR